MMTQVIITKNQSHNKTGLKCCFQALLALGFILILSSCSDYLKGKPYKSQVLEIQSAPQLECLENISNDMKNFLDSKGTDADVDRTVNCINNTLTLLQTKVEGSQEASSYTTEDIYKIFNQFSNQAQITKEAATNVVKLKAAILGGSDAKITKSEIDSLKQFLSVVKVEAKKLRPYIQVLYFKKTDKQYSKDFIAQAVGQLNSTLRVLYRSTQLGSSSYSVENFKEMMVSILSLSEESLNTADVLSKLSKVISGQHSLLTESQRFTYIDNVTELIRLYSIYVNGHAKFEISTSENLNEVFTLVESAVNWVENTLQYRATQNISSQTLDALVSAIVKARLINDKMTAYTLTIFYRTVLVRVFESGAKGDILNFNGIKAIHLRNLRKELATYRVYSKIVERIAGEKVLSDRGLTQLPLREAQELISRMSVSAETEILSRYDSALRNEIVNNVTDLRQEFFDTNPVIFKNKKIGLAVNQNTWNQRWVDLARGVYVKMLTRLLMQGWGHIYPVENLSMSYMTQTEMFNWYSEFKNFGIELKFLDHRKHNSGLTAFMTSNLFTRNANGDDKVYFRELYENFAVVVSGGTFFDEEIKVDMQNAGCNLPQLDVLDEHYNSESCFLNLIQQNYKRYFSTLTHLTAYLDKLNDVQVKEYIQSAIGVIRVEESNAGIRVEAVDLLSMNALVSYVENIYVLHDANRNELISESEIRQAYPKFSKIATDFAYTNSRDAIEEFTSWQGSVAGYGCFSEQDLIRESFIFLIYNGRTPTISDLNSVPCFTGKPLINFSGEIDRMRMMNNFKGLKTALGL